MWLVKPDVLQTMRSARSLGYEPTLEERERFADQMREAYAARPGDAPRNLAIAGSTAEILIEGVLTEKPDCFALMFGGGNTTYESIRKALAIADADPAVKELVLHVASPGGAVHGLFETLAALDAFSKPIKVKSNYAASAAFAIAAVAGPIEALTPASAFGSIGVAIDAKVSDDWVHVTSSAAPKKRPDLRTEEGIAMVREELDAIHEQFVLAIASGRSASTGREITTAHVNAEFGRGGMFTAATARKAGMIDRIAAQPKRTRPGRSSRSSASDDAEPVATDPTMGEVLAGRADGESAEAYVERVLEQMGQALRAELSGRPAPKPPSREELAERLESLTTAMPTPFARGVPSGAEDVATRIESPTIEPAPAVEFSDVTPEALADALERLPASALPRRAAAPPKPPAPATVDREALADQVEALLAQGAA